MAAGYDGFTTSYHVHSCVSDGTAEVVEYILAASRQGLNEVGISDHYTLTTDRRQFEWSMPVDGLDDYVEAVQTAAGEAEEDLIVRLGIEMDYIPETVAEVRNLLMFQPFDYVIGSVHFVDGFAIDAAPEDWMSLTQERINEINRVYWQRVTEMANTGLYDIAGHLDLPKKFAYYPSVDLSIEINDALDALKESGMTVELNTSGWHVPARDQYPNEAILRCCFEREIPVMICADAHKPEHLTRGFDDARGVLRKIGFTETASYSGRMRIMNALR